MNAPGEADLRALILRADEAIVGLRAITDAAVRADVAERALGAVNAALYDAMAARASWADFRDATDRARAGCAEALAGLQETESDDPRVAQTLHRIAWLLRELAHVRPPVTDEPGPIPPPEVPLRATLARPRLLCPPRRSIAAAVPLAEREPLEAPAPPTAPPMPLAPGAASAEAVLARALAAAAAPAEPPPPEPDPEPVVVTSPDDLLFGEAISEEALQARRTRDLAEELGAMGRMRRHDDALPWKHGEETERRLLTRVDALVAIGSSAFVEMVRMLEERPLADPELAWALLMVLGSVGGADTAAALRRTLLALELDDPDVEDYPDVIADALAHAPHPGVRAVLAPWLESPEPHRRRVAHAALGMRRELSLEEAVRGANDTTVEVAVSCVRAIGSMEGPVAAGLLYGPLADARPQVARAAMICAVQHRYEVGLRAAIHRCETGLASEAGAAMIVAIGGDHPRGRQILLDAATREATPVTMRALGWYGDVAAFEALVNGLDADEDTARAAWSSLERITGAELLADDVEPEYEEDDRPFLRKRSTPTVFPFSEGCADPEAWRAWWKAHGPLARADVRYRFGRPWAPTDSIAEMRAPVSTQAIRLYDHLDLCARTGGRVPFEPHAFLSRQHALLGLWDTHVGSVDAGLGRWPTRYVG